MYNLESSVLSVPGIGPKYAKLLENLDIETVEDLVYHVPFRYEDLTKIKSIADLKPKEAVTVAATLLKVDNIFTRNRKRLTKAKFVDETGELEVVWFNQHYLKKQLKTGKKYFLSGRTQEFNRKLSLIAPTHEEVGEDSLNTGRLVPIYPETSGLSSRWLRARNNDVLSVLALKEELVEFIPEKLLKETKLPNLSVAIKHIHFPETMEQASLARKRLAFGELLTELLRVEERKQKWHKEYKGVELPYKSFKKEVSEMIANLPFELTQGQNKALEGVFKDLSTKNPMNRLLEGDVGSGKTIVAVVAAYLSHLSGYKTLYLAPTEILAKQHHETFKQFLDPYGVSTKLRTGSNKTDDILKDSDDIVVGTHALLFEEKPFTNVGLVIIDEQHRFGVKQRAKLLQMGTKSAKPNLLTMTATPIPRTLALTLYGDLDISVLEGVPNKDKKITTKVFTEKERAAAFKWIKKRREQAFIVCPFIQQSTNETFENVKAAETEYEKLKEGVFKDLSIGLLHGKMKPKEKAKVIQDFRDKKYQILVSTPVIEVGVDIPDTTIIVIESAERYGLASLHQLRGRVGRGNKEGFCFLFMSGYSKTSKERLKNLEKISDGLKLAEIDMKNRGEGDVFGTMQHGFKTFKFASISDVDLIQQAKEAADDLVGKLDKHPALQKKVALVAKPERLN